jgi:ATP-dependent RNA helicase TDRD9
MGALASLNSGEVNPHDGDLTFMGRVMAEMPCDPLYGRLMVLGHVFGLLEECIIISACLHMGSFFAQPFHSRFFAYKYVFIHFLSFK